MNFLDENLLEVGCHLFREKEEGETLEEYREAFSHFMLPRDAVMANEIRLEKGWDLWTEEEIMDWLLDTPKNLILESTLAILWVEMYGEKLAAYKRQRERRTGMVSTGEVELAEYNTRGGVTLCRTADQNPAGFKEAIQTRLNYPPKDAPPGIKIRHFDKEGKETVTNLLPFRKKE
jgi:hypothetical protein